MPITSEREVRGESEDDKEKVHKQFETYNKKFNRVQKKYTDFMEFRSFKHISCDIPCLGNIKRDDRLAVFDKQSTDGTGCLTFHQFQKAVNMLADLEVQYRSKLNESNQAPAREDIKMQVREEILQLNPNNVRQWFKSMLNLIVDNEPSISRVASGTGNTLKMIGKTSVEMLGHVGTAVTWIGPAVKLLEIIWRRITALDEITDDLVKFVDTLSYLTETIEFIDESSLYKTNMMKNRIKGLEKMLKTAEALFNDVEENGNNKVKKFFSAKENQKRLQDMEEDLTKWISQTYFIQLAENQELTIELQSQQQVMQKDLTEFISENRSRWKELKKVLSLSAMVETNQENHDSAGDGDCRDSNVCAVPPRVEMAQASHTAATGKDDNLHVSISAALPLELQKSNSDFLIYHDYEDQEKAKALRDKLTKEMRKFRLEDGTIEVVRVHILDDFHSYGVPQARLEAALQLASVKLLLVTSHFPKLKNLGAHPLEIFKILQDSRTGEVFALRDDADYKSYLPDLDFYVQGLMQGCSYDPNSEDFVSKMTDLFRRHLMSRVSRDKKLDEERSLALGKEEQVHKSKEEGLKEVEKKRDEIEKKLEDPNISEQETEQLLEELNNL
ncbi:cytadherence high molecular weight protein 2-like [Lineus longissimus]|uniref:cytadherence high molecular weight protein 2-like n=1 Tax=Lineus longissimus TaxID=88925 RepID=UPI002B4DFE29